MVAVCTDVVLRSEEIRDDVLCVDGMLRSRTVDNGQELDSAFSNLDRALWATALEMDLRSLVNLKRLPYPGSFALRPFVLVKSSKVHQIA
jgi:hypothetical protein